MRRNTAWPRVSPGRMWLRRWWLPSCMEYNCSMIRAATVMWRTMARSRAEAELKSVLIRVGRPWSSSAARASMRRRSTMPAIISSKRSVNEPF